SAPDRVPGMPISRPPAHPYTKRRQQGSYSAPVAGTSGRGDQGGVSGAPHTSDLLLAAGRILCVKGAEPPTLFIGEPALSNLPDQVAAELEVCCWHPELVVPVTALYNLSSA